jgi:hypothetical protein
MIEIVGAATEDSEETDRSRSSTGLKSGSEPRCHLPTSAVPYPPSSAVPASVGWLAATGQYSAGSAAKWFFEPDRQTGRITAVMSATRVAEQSGELEYGLP